MQTYTTHYFPAVLAPHVSPDPPCFPVSICCRSQEGSPRPCQRCSGRPGRERPRSLREVCMPRPGCFEKATRWKKAPSSLSKSSKERQISSLTPSSCAVVPLPAEVPCLSESHVCLCSDKHGFEFTDQHLQYGAQVFIGLIPAHLQFTSPRIKGNVLISTPSVFTSVVMKTSQSALSEPINSWHQYVWRCNPLLKPSLILSPLWGVHVWFHMFTLGQFSVKTEAWNS